MCIIKNNKDIQKWQMIVYQTIPTNRAIKWSNLIRPIIKCIDPPHAQKKCDEYKEVVSYENMRCKMIKNN